MRVSFYRRRREARGILCLVFFCVCVFLLLLALTEMKPVFEQKAMHGAKVKAIEIINSSANEVFAGISTADSVNITMDENGKVTAVNADAVAMNNLKTKLSQSFLKHTENAKETTLYIPLGSLTRYAPLQGVGYRIPVKIAIDGFSQIDFESDFESCGINQVRHKIYMTAAVNVSVISAAMTKSETVTAKIPVSETVIVGAVPNYYGNNLGVIGR